MKELVLHIGTPKTGTTSLQKFLLLNAARLAERGYEYPLLPGHQKTGGGNKNAHFLAWYGRGLVEPSFAATQNGRIGRADAKTFRRRITQYGGTVLLSDEALFRLGAEHVGFWPAIADYCRTCGFIRVKVVIYLRRQDLFVASLWRQRVKGKNWCAQSFDEFLHTDPEVRACIDYDAQLSGIEACFGKENVIVRRYDRGQFTGGDIYRDFCAAAGIGWCDDFEVPAHEHNPSPTCDLTEIKRLVNLSIPRHRPRSLYIFFRELFNHASFESYGAAAHLSPISPETAAALLERCEAGNRRIAERHFGREVLFPDEIQPERVWERDPEALFELAVDLLTQALVAERARVGRLERLLCIPLARNVWGVFNKFRL